MGDHHDVGVHHGGLFGNRVTWSRRYESFGDRYSVDGMHVGRSLYLTLGYMLYAYFMYRGATLWWCDESSSYYFANRSQYQF